MKNMMIDLDMALEMLHDSPIGFSYSMEPSRYTIQQEDLPELFEYIFEKGREYQLKGTDNHRK